VPDGRVGGMCRLARRNVTARAWSVAAEGVSGSVTAILGEFAAIWRKMQCACGRSRSEAAYCGVCASPVPGPEVLSAVLARRQGERQRERTNSPPLNLGVTCVAAFVWERAVATRSVLYALCRCAWVRSSENECVCFR
jgi:hypothetical protein